MTFRVPNMRRMTLVPLLETLGLFLQMMVRNLVILMGSTLGM